MIGYLQYAVGENPVGCLKERELYTANFEPGYCASFRSPLVDPSEVNKIQIVRNDILNKWFGYFKDQDVVMFNMYDISAPQQGGADFDGDIFFLCNEPIVIGSKIDKHIILDVEDKVTAKSKPYTKENLIEYEVMTRDNRIGEITNVATSIENRYTTNPDIQKLYSDSSSLLRIFQGKEIDFLKTGFRWHMNSGLRKHLKQLPYFLLHNYPQKMKTYQNILSKNKGVEPDEKEKLNAYRSHSPMNELCEYIETWEKKNIKWDNSVNDLIDTRCLIVNNDLNLKDKGVIKECKKFINMYADEIKQHLNLHKDENNDFSMDEVVKKYKDNISEKLKLDEDVIANYVIATSYSSLSISKSLAWAAYGEYIIENLKNNTNPKRNISIREVPYKSYNTYEYLGKYYEFEVGDTYLRL